MSERSTSSHALVFADACLLSAGAFAVTTAIGGLLVLVVLRGQLGLAIAALVGPVATGVTLLSGAVGAPLLHRVRFGWLPVVGMAAGLVVGGGALATLVPAVMLGVVRPLFGPRGDAIGLFVAGGAASAAFLATVAWLAVKAWRDLRSGEPLNARLDRYRLVSAALVVLFAIAIGVLVALDPRSEIGEAAPFGIGFALAGGFMALGASVFSSFRGPRQDAEAPAGDASQAS